MALDALQDFDRLAAACAAAYADGDDAAGDRLFLELWATELAPDLQRRLRFFAWDPEVREEAYSRVIDQVYVRMLRRGKPVQRRWLSTIYRRCTFDELAAVSRHSSRAEQIGADDDLEAVIGLSAAGLAQAAQAIDRVDIERLIAHVETDLRRERWGRVLRAMLEGHTRGSDIAHVTGMTQVRVRQTKMELRRYVDGPGRELLGRGAVR